MNHILIVDDKEENLYYLQALLAGHGYAVDCARHGAEALVRARQKPPDLIISDLLMPVMDGYTLLRHWKADARLKEIPFMVYTATYTAPEDEKLALDLGADAFVLKPAEPEDFMARVYAVEANASAATPCPANQPGAETEALLQSYSQSLIRKLEEKTLQLEEINLALQLDVAKQKLFGQTLQLLESVVEQSKDSILITEANLDLPGPKIIFVNPAFSTMTGYSEEEVIGKTPRILQGPRTNTSVIHQLRQCLERGQPFEGETINYRKDGTEYFQEWHISPIRNSDGKVTHFVSIQRDISERVRAAASLAESQQRLALATESAEIGIWDWDVATGRMIWDARMFELYGIPFGNEMQAMEAWKNGLHPGDQRRAEAEIADALTVTGDLHSEFRIAWPNGETRHLEATGMVRRGDDGVATRMIGVSRDITERKRAVNALRTSEQRFRIFMEHNPAAAWITDSEGQLIYVSPGYYRMFGIKETMVGRKIGDFYGSELANVYLENNRRAIEDDQVIEVVEPGKRADGTDGEFLVVKFPMDMPDGGRVVGGIALDITERKRAEARFRRLVESNVHGIMFWNAEGVIVDANNAFLEMVGYSREDLTAGKLSAPAMTPPEFHERDSLSAQELKARKVFAPFEKEYLRKDGSRVPILIGGAAFEDTPDAGVSFVLELTDRKKLEQQFLRAQRMESIGTLAGGIAHDLNNVLGPIVMSIELLKLSFPDAATRELLDVISSSADQGASMVQQVLSFARGVEGQRMQVAVQHIVQNVQKIATETFFKDIQVRTRVPADLWTVTGDATQLHQVLLNLCVNARDAMPGGGRLTLTAENVELDAQYAGLNIDAKPGSYVCIQVEDSGTGMPPELLEKIFDPFFTTKEVGRGTGLGLSTSLAIVKSHGGFIQVNSAVGKGTQFRIYLPSHNRSPSVGSANAVRDLPRGNGELILVVDDENSVRQVTKCTLESFGYRTVLAADGADAVAVYAARGSEIAAVITDMMMPVMDGPATIQVLLKINPSVRIIAVSGLASNAKVANLGSLGVKHFLPKPYTAATLLKTLKSVIS